MIGLWAYLQLTVNDLVLRLQFRPLGSWLHHLSITVRPASFLGKVR